MINPALKIARNAKRLGIDVTKQRKARRRGKLSQVEKAIVAEVVHDSPFKQLGEKQIDALAVTLRRNPEAIISAIANARETLQLSARPYVDIHRKAVEGALAAGDFDVARKGAMEMVDKISARNADGKVERIVEKVEAESTAPRVQIGIMLGGLRDK